jgi:hypothetical protein
MGQPGRDSQNTTAEIQPGHDSQNGTARTEKADRTVRTAEQDHQGRIVRTRLSRHDCQTGKPGQDSQNRMGRKGQP